MSPAKHRRALQHSYRLPVPVIHGLPAKGVSLDLAYPQLRDSTAFQVTRQLQWSELLYRLANWTVPKSQALSAMT